jgi:hypothetical protein
MAGGVTVLCEYPLTAKLITHASSNAAVSALRPRIEKHRFRSYAAPLSSTTSIGFPCFQLETRELALNFEEEGRLASKASHAGIIRIGF